MNRHYVGLPTRGSWEHGQTATLLGLANSGFDQVELPN